MLPIKVGPSRSKIEGMHRKGPLVFARIPAEIWQWVCGVSDKDRRLSDPQGMTFATRIFHRRQRQTCDC
jgi:hypothetical protein